MAFAVTPDGLRLHYKRLGVGEPLLLLAGQSSDHREWDRVAQDFMKDFEVIVWDYRGTGQSGKSVSETYSTRGFASDALAVLDACGHVRAHVYGFSMGGRVAQWLAIDHPARIGALVLGATSPGNKHGVPREARVDQVLRGIDMNAVLLTSFTPDWIRANGSLVEAIAALWSRELPSQVRSLHYQASEGHDSWNCLPLIKAPTLVLHGSDDEINPASNAELLSRRIPDAQLQLLQGARHYYFEELRSYSHQLVRNFLLAHPLKSWM